MPTNKKLLTRSYQKRLEMFKAAQVAVELGHNVVSIAFGPDDATWREAAILDTWRWHLILEIEAVTWDEWQIRVDELDGKVDA